MIILKGKDGSVAIMELAPEADKEEAIRKFRECYPEGFYPEYYEGDFKLPKSRQFRDAWKLKEGKIVVDERVSKQIHLGRVREQRDKDLYKLDFEQLRYLSNPEKLKEIEESKQKLRDLPKTLKWPLEDL